MPAAFSITTVDETDPNVESSAWNKCRSFALFYQCQVVNIFATPDQKRGEFEQKQVKRQRVVVSDSDESQ